MKVAFWNAISSTDSVTNYVAAIGMHLVTECHSNVVLSGNYISNRMLQDCFSRRMLEDGIAHTPYCYLYGSSEYRDALWRMKRNRQGNILEMPINRMKIIYPPDETAKSMFYYKIRQRDFYLLDMAKCNVAESKNVLDEAELVVVFLSQDKTEIQNFFERFSSLIPKALFIFVNNQRDKKESFRILKEDYGVNSNKIGHIPDNRNFYMACEEGNMSRFFADSIYRTDEKQDGNFTNSIKKLAKKIYGQGVCLWAKKEKDE